MKKCGKIVLLSLGPIVLLFIILAFVLLLKPFPDDFGTFVSMRNDFIEFLEQHQASERSINRYFEDYSLSLNPLYRSMFKTKNLTLFLKSYESPVIETATVNQLEIGKNTGNYFDFTFMIRPRPEYSLPFFHGDALKSMPGVDGALYMDFYSFSATLDLDSFFGAEADKIREAMDLARPYWKTEGFGELTLHLDPYKSPFRLEMVEPERAPEEERRQYFDTARRCFQLYLKAYVTALAQFEGREDQSVSGENRAAVEEFVSILYEHDVAVKMGKKIFPEEDFDRYFLDGFWGVGGLQAERAQSKQ